MFAKLRLLLPNISRRTITCHYRNHHITPRDFANCSNESGKLSTRLFQYIALDHIKLDLVEAYTKEYRDFYPIHNHAEFRHKLQNCPSNELAKVVINFHVWKTNLENYVELANVMNILDDVCAQRVCTLTRFDVQNILYAFLYVLPNQITKLHFYPLAVRLLVDTFESNLSKHHFVHTCFYIGLWKKNYESTNLLQSLVNRHFNKYLDKVTTIDLVIIASAAFKTSMKMNLKHVKRFEKELFELDVKDDPVLNAFIKIIRLNSFRSLKLAKLLQNWIVSGQLNHLQFRGFTHIFMFFADNLFKDSHATRCLIENCLHRVQEDYVKYQHDKILDRHLPNDMRAKDFAMFLWCLAQLNAKSEVTTEQLDQIRNVIIEKVHCGEYDRDYDCFVETCLSLWMLNYKCKELVWHLFHNRNIIIPEEGRDRIKIDSRKHLLFSCIEIENSDWLQEFGIPLRRAFDAEYPAKSFLTERAPNLQKVSNIIKNKYPMLDIKLVKQIRDLNIPGIMVRVKPDKISFIEVLEKTTILSDGYTPLGMMELKLRLLKESGCSVETVSTLE